MAIDTDSIPIASLNTASSDFKSPQVNKQVAIPSTALNKYDSDTDSDSDSVSSCPNTQVDRIYQKQDQKAVFGNVMVSQSSDVHFGNKTYINGPVTIKQIVGAKLDEGTGNGIGEGGIINSGFKIDCTDPYERDKYKGANSHDCTRDQSDSEFCGSKCFPKSWSLRAKTLTIVVLCILFLIIISLVLSMTLKNGKNDEGYYTLLNTNEALSRNIPIKTDIDKVLLLGSNLRIVSRQEWIAQPPSEPLDSLQTPVPYVIITHTATENCSDQASCVFHVRTIQTYHLESRGWSDIGYNFLVGGDGSVYEGRGWDKLGSHTKSYNAKSIGIAFIGTFNTVIPPERQIVAAQRLIAFGVELKKISKDYKLFGHRQLIPSLSPGDRLFEEIQKWPHWSEKL